MSTLIGFLLFTIFLLLSGIHFYWGLGGKWGGDAAIPAKVNHAKLMNPGLFECFVVAVGLLGFGMFVLVKVQVILFYLPVWLLNYGLWIISAIFIIRAIGEFKYVGFSKKITNTKFGQLDTKFYSPLCLAIGLLGIILELII